MSFARLIKSDCERERAHTKGKRGLISPILPVVLTTNTWWERDSMRWNFGIFTSRFKLLFVRPPKMWKTCGSHSKSTLYKLFIYPPIHLVCTGHGVIFSLHLVLSVFFSCVREFITMERRAAIVMVKKKKRKWNIKRNYNLKFDSIWLRTH